ncbi:hypothetical protein H6G76_35395 [Nostoc sp. FACHB-152]|uniref:hypothetical protein n=1 Tax=unclassified Nostoc TaxID=2593658 RepID=UPI00168629E3|nr:MULTISPECIES: hypothetical protein [unclassified Nostoc]MBD2452298.1 hypothetical protein [Nostoc sp. FACHB-152]MBD2473262.1 hypothetical protein [Nostoc sp. FACHB-145]
MNLIKLKMAKAAAALTMLASLAPESAHAQRFRFSGTSNLIGNPPNQVQAEVSFDLNTSILDINPNNSMGFYPRAIENFTDNGGSLFNPIPPQSGNLVTSRIDRASIQNTPIPGRPDITYGQLVYDIAGLSNNLLRYDITLQSNPNTRLILFVQNTDGDLINSLSGISEATQIPGILIRPDVTEIFGFSDFPSSTSFTHIWHLYVQPQVK